jgi:hypothetical protein
MMPMADGGHLVVDATGTPLGRMMAARSADGQVVPVSYHLDGSTVVVTLDTAEPPPGAVDAWWNPISWDWGTVSKKCAKSAAVAIIGKGTQTVITNIILHATGRALATVAGGAGYVGWAAGGCVIELIRS